MWVVWIVVVVGVVVVVDLMLILKVVLGKLLSVWVSVVKFWLVLRLMCVSLVVVRLVIFV